MEKELAHKLQIMREDAEVMDAQLKEEEKKCKEMLDMYQIPKNMYQRAKYVPDTKKYVPESKICTGVHNMYLIPTIMYQRA